MNSNLKIKFCSSCLAMSTRPRITFDKNGSCNACQWIEKKKKINWNERKAELLNLLATHKKKNIMIALCLSAEVKMDLTLLII